MKKKWISALVCMAMVLSLLPAAAFAVLLFQGGREVGQESRKRLFQPICICLAAINTEAFPAYREKAPRWASAWQAAQFFNP